MRAGAACDAENPVMFALNIPVNPPPLIPISVLLPPRPATNDGVEVVVRPIIKYKTCPGDTDITPETYAPDPPEPRDVVGFVSGTAFCPRPPAPHRYTRILVMLAGTVYVRIVPLPVNVVVVTSPSCVVVSGRGMFRITAVKFDA
jgi:hypothetical protein